MKKLIVKFTVVTLLMSTSFLAGARRYFFDPNLLVGGNDNVDTSLFEQGNQLPGTYLVDIILNGNKVDSTNVAFHSEKSPSGEPFLQSCLTKEQLSRYVWMLMPILSYHRH